MVEQYLFERADEESSVSTYLTGVSTLKRPMRDLIFDDQNSKNTHSEGDYDENEIMTKIDALTTESSHTNRHVIHPDEFGRRKIVSRADTNQAVAP